MQFSESLYPLTFRAKDAQALGQHLRLRHSVELVGMKHVGISNFLQFFLYHGSIVKTYIRQGRHMFVAVDLNDLVERDMFAFWILVLKRFADKAETFPDIALADKKTISALFLNSIQSRNFFLAFENLREIIKIIIRNNILPTIFLVSISNNTNFSSVGYFDQLISATLSLSCFFVGVVCINGESFPHSFLCLQS